MAFLEYLNLTKPDRYSSKLTWRHGSLRDDLGAHFGFERASNTRHNTVFLIRLKTFSFFFLMRKFFLDSNWSQILYFLKMTDDFAGILEYHETDLKNKGKFIRQYNIV